jgi:hypothetical protein
MIAAIYARKSTAETGMNDEEKSVTRQIEHGKAYALTKGWTVSEDHIYSDDGICGAEFGDVRPGFMRLMSALKPKPPFQVLVMSEESRLGREQTRTQYTPAFGLPDERDCGVCRVRRVHRLPAAAEGVRQERVYVRVDRLPQRPADQSGHHGLRPAARPQSRARRKAVGGGGRTGLIAEIRAGQTTFPDQRLAAEAHLVLN